ncbi:MAG: SDR family oxidoreductase [Acidobacteriota bacterium]|nr:SDR family oxidoreductase [Acidobacteriota bacterium]
MTPRVLLTGATGYIGGRLLTRLEREGRHVRCLVRDASRLEGPRGEATEVVEGDVLDEAALDRALAGVHTAYYLVHSMAANTDYDDVDRKAASAFGRTAARAGVKRIVYLGGLTDDTAPMSKHLKSRAETGRVLRDGGVPVIEFRASVVIGAGSLSFEMIAALVERLPVMVTPRWVSTPTQPIAIADVLAYLVAALDLPEGSQGVFEIGGADVVTYGGMMREYAALRGLRRAFLSVPLLTPHLSGLWLALVTPAQARVGRALVEGLRNPTVVHSDAARTVFTIEPTPLRAAFLAAIDEGAPARLKRDSRTISVRATPEAAFTPVRRIGGDAGWYFGDPIWRLRGWLDHLAGGIGFRKGRRDADACAVGEQIDGWTVEAYTPDRLLRLSADMKLPGKGWLEFEVTPLGQGRSAIRQTATFDPRGILGRAYWYGVAPFHAVIFRGMLGRIGRLAARGLPEARRK